MDGSLFFTPLRLWLPDSPVDMEAREQQNMVGSKLWMRKSVSSSVKHEMDKIESELPQVPGELSGRDWQSFEYRRHHSGKEVTGYSYEEEKAGSD